MNAPFVKPYIKNERDGWLEIGGAEDFSVFRTFDCGQCFRFAPPAAPQLPEQVDGVAFGKKVSFAGHDGTLFVRSSPEDFENIWRSYLDLDTDYSAISEFVVSALPDGGGREHMKKAAEASRGIHILRQDSWEALCSFIISQNNNIPRIRKIIAAMSAAYGDDLVGDYAFPKPQALSDAGEDAIFALRTGFRAKYIADAAEKVSSGKLSADMVNACKSYGEAEELLCTVKGVGPKVAACTLLFGFGRKDAFPVDVWIKKVIANRFPDGLDPSVFGAFAGVAQQYLFYYERYIGG